MSADREGFTLTEMALCAAVISLVVVGLVRLTASFSRFLSQSQIRHQATLKSRICLENIQRVFNNGKASTLQISTPPITPTSPNSRAQFSTADGTTYVITLSSTPANSVHLTTIEPGGLTQDKVLATDVNLLIFAVDYRDPALVNVNLQIAIPRITGGTMPSAYTFFYPNLRIHMMDF